MGGAHPTKDESKEPLSVPIASPTTHPGHAPIAVETARAWVASRSRAEAGPGSVLVHAPSSAFQAPGGGENQLVQTARGLETMGVDVRLFSPWTDRIDRHRVLHLFGMSREGSRAGAGGASGRGVPVVLSPICWLEPRSLLRPGADRGRGGSWDLAKWIGSSGADPADRRLARRADPPRRRQSCPTPSAEADQLRPPLPCAPSGVDPGRARTGSTARFETGRPRPRSARCHDGPGDFVLYTGRIEPRKNVSSA